MAALDALERRSLPTRRGRCVVRALAIARLTLGLQVLAALARHVDLRTLLALGPRADERNGLRSAIRLLGLIFAGHRTYLVQQTVPATPL